MISSNKAIFSPNTAVIDLNVLSDALNIEVKESFDLLPYSFCSIYFLKFFKFFSSIELFWNFLILVIVIWSRLIFPNLYSSKKNPEFQNEYKNFKKCLSEINNYFEKISNDNNIKNNKIDTTLIDTKKEYLDNYVFNAIVNHANYYYKSKKKNHINEDKIIEEIILNDYLKNKKKSRFNILKNYLSNSNPKSKFKNRYQVENAIRKINDEMEDAQKEFSKLFQNNEKDYN